ncbi:acetyl-/propionyl-coenzyme A carboxylase alpha chain [Variibacter gotjawalensis]|uniref:Acetyl-/propionyl-coenzyme A carboxylase alpha chain n=1 Tax=Variibacter gotjawalensis TaxID=1333996 RepID=A0A0S3PXX9_9BRAD|nr:biotin carboxylase N-terminal domain-containing protein [Variibacter gotjawalensis]NIK46647.1 3-methylcrotonyl-CoA carboxylase alpha subunit [Variibacter gotjawalensis]RZS48550.1 3-methylcrotonyl-CoA carboxylase alpha subunit [Variibacter gotjawalensis]BAT60812.1 acetyl-/propionyl-coenzyme A carboxylase alpha chain [Variibacter gotjawalensis]
MLKSVLIANRGEIACRIARTAKALGMRTIAVYSDADAKSLHVQVCDEAHHIGAAPPRESYLVAEKIIAVAKKAGADCVHPGYGFLSENAAFAEACAAAGLVFVGPPPNAIRAMGLKDAAKALMEKAGVPVVPGYHGERQEPTFLKQKAYEIGYPVLIKAVAGGGGKGMRRVDKHADFDDALEGAMREAQGAFGDNRVLIEKYVLSPRHVEIQVFGDNYGNAVHLNERDCSLQRRHQKVIEESPAPGMSPQVRDAMGRAAVAAAKAVGYSGAGTVEFIADGAGALRADGFWFMEMNTRLQVEHPVTEMVTGLDLVEWQFRVASGEKLPLEQKDIRLNGHAVEARLYAEDPERGFVPSTGRVIALELPQREGVRIDAGVAAGMDVTPYYDPMIAKVIAHAPTRTEALDRLADVMDHTAVAGPRTNAAFLSAICKHPEFRAEKFDTGFIERHMEDLGAVPRAKDTAAVAAGAARLFARETTALHERARRVSTELHSPWSATDAFSFSGDRKTSIALIADGERIRADISYPQRAKAVATISVDGAAAASDAHVIDHGRDVYVLRGGRQFVVHIEDPAIDADHGGGDGAIKAPMHGKLLALFVNDGDTVDKGARVAVIEAMKMEHTLTAPIAGTVRVLNGNVGAQVAEGTGLVQIEAAT